GVAGLVVTGAGLVVQPALYGDGAADATTARYPVGQLTRQRCAAVMPVGCGCAIPCVEYGRGVALAVAGHLLAVHAPAAVRALAEREVDDRFAEITYARCRVVLAPRRPVPVRLVRRPPAGPLGG